MTQGQPHEFLRKGDAGPCCDGATSSCLRLTLLIDPLISPSSKTLTDSAALRLYNQPYMNLPRLNIAFGRCAAFVAVLVAFALCSAVLAGCGGDAGGSGSGGGSGASQASGAAFTPATGIAEATFHEDEATGQNGALIDTSATSEGYVAVSATASSHLKLQVTSGNSTENFDLPADGTPTVAPLVFGDGAYTFRVMQNTSGNNYVELASATADVALASEFAPFLRPNVFCNFNASSACVTKARELVASASNQGEAVQAICEYVVDNVSYDDAKAEQLKSTSGYVPDPDETLASGTGICFDYASLGAAMLRSQGFPTKIVTGYVSPGDIYHAWIMVYVDGTWKSAQFSVSQNTWSRVDLTFAASGGGSNVGDGKEYTDRYVY